MTRSLESGATAAMDSGRRIAIGQSASQLATVPLSPILNEPMPNELHRWRIQWKQDQERLDRLRHQVTDGALQISASGEVLAFGGRPDRDWVQLVTLISNATCTTASRPVLIANLAGGATLAGLQAALRGFTQVNSVVSPAGSSVPDLFGPGADIVSTILSLVTSAGAMEGITASEQTRHPLERVVAAIGEEIQFSARPVTVLSAVLDIAAGLARDTETGVDATDVSHESLRAAVTEVRTQFGKLRDPSELGSLAHMVRALRRFEGRAAITDRPAPLQIVNLDEDLVPPGERDLGRAILAEFLRRRVLSSQPGVVIVIDAGKLDSERWRTTSVLDPQTLLVTIYQEFSGQGSKSASPRVPFMVFFRLAGRDAVEAGTYFGSDEAWRLLARGRQRMSSAQENGGRSTNVSWRGPGVGSTISNGLTDGVSQSETEQRVEEDRIRANRFMDLDDGEFIFYERRPDSRPMTGRLLMPGGLQK